MQNRIIKFRVWLENEKRFSYHDLSLYEDVSGLAFILEKEMPYKIQQFTGLKDNTKWEDLKKEEQKEWLKNNRKEEWNGKEIYEGDIVKSWRGISEVTFGIGGEGEPGDYIGYYRGWCVGEEKWETNSFDGEEEIIGNIFEDASLLDNIKINK